MRKVVKYHSSVRCLQNRQHSTVMRQQRKPHTLAPLSQGDWTALHYAACKGYVDVMTILFQRGIDTEQKDAVREILATLPPSSLELNPPKRAIHPPPRLPSLSSSPARPSLPSYLTV